MRLIVTGSGRVSCAAGVATLAARDQRTGASAWLNVGIAGHPTYPVGYGVHAVSILEAATDRRWYPVQVLELPGTGETLCTVDTPEVGYPEPLVYEMEASAFYATALRYTCGELIQVYKVISDNREDRVEIVDKHAVRNLIIQHLPIIEKMAVGLSGLAAEVEETQPKLREFERILARWHFTVSQQHQLRTLLNRWETLYPDEPVVDAALNRCPSAKSLLAEIEARLHGVYDEADSAAK